MSDLFAHLTKWEFDTYVSDNYSFVKQPKFLILMNATSMSATNQHSSKWYPRLIIGRSDQLCSVNM